MAVNCGYCGEELIGSVNCCWKCGRAVESRPGPANLPPVRREKPLATPAEQAELADEQANESEVVLATPAESEAPVETGGSDQPPHVSAPIASGTVYHGSPFAPLVKPSAPRTPVAPPSYPQNAAASGGALASFCLGIMSLAIAMVFWRAPAIALVISLLGICMGIWGMYSTRRSYAGMGLFLCIGAFGLSSYLGVVQLYVLVHGVSPFEQLDTDEFPLE